MSSCLVSRLRGGGCLRVRCSRVLKTQSINRGLSSSMPPRAASASAASAKTKSGVGSSPPPITHVCCARDGQDVSVPLPVRHPSPAEPGSLQTSDSRCYWSAIFCDLPRVRGAFPSNQPPAVPQRVPQRDPTRPNVPQRAHPSGAHFGGRVELHGGCQRALPAMKRPLGASPWVRELLPLTDSCLSWNRGGVTPPAAISGSWVAWWG